MKHRHAELMKIYAEDAMETERPWERWEYRYSADGEWIPLVNHPCHDSNQHPEWNDYTEYRRKPRTININGHEVPEPVRSPLIRGTTYHVPNLVNYGGKLSEDLLWDDDMLDHFSLNLGMVHLSEEAAIKHAEALLSSFSRIEK